MDSCVHQPGVQIQQNSGRPQQVAAAQELPVTVAVSVVLTVPISHDVAVATLHDALAKAVRQQHQHQQRLGQHQQSGTAVHLVVEVSTASSTSDEPMLVSSPQYPQEGSESDLEAGLVPWPEDGSDSMDVAQQVLAPMGAAVKEAMIQSQLLSEEQPAESAQTAATGAAEAGGSVAGEAVSTEAAGSGSDHIIIQSLALVVQASSSTFLILPTLTDALSALGLPSLQHLTTASSTRSSSPSVTITCTNAYIKVKAADKRHLHQQLLEYNHCRATGQLQVVVQDPKMLPASARFAVGRTVQQVKLAAAAAAGSPDLPPSALLQSCWALRVVGRTSGLVVWDCGELLGTQSATQQRQERQQQQQGQRVAARAGHGAMACADGVTAVTGVNMQQLKVLVMENQAKGEG